MGLRNTASEWGWPHRILHWLVAIGIGVLLWLGLEQAGMESGDARWAVRETHASFALLVFVLMTLRLVWRFANPVPQHPAGSPAWQRVSATIVHALLYVVVFAQLVGGAMTFTTTGRELPFFGLFTIPLPVAEDEEAHHFWEEAHEFLWKPLALLLVIHLLAALFNHFVRRNDVLRRMTTGA